MTDPTKDNRYIPVNDGSRHVHTCKDPVGPGHRDGFGCTCECGAVYHFTGWQVIKTLPQHENPCAVILEEETPPFDVEDYRSDLVRRIESLHELARQVPPLTPPHHRYMHKAQGLQLAVDLLPRPVTNA